MLPTPTPIILSDPAAATASSPLNVALAVLIMAIAIGLQVLLYYRRRRLAEQIRASKKRS